MAAIPMTTLLDSLSDPRRETKNKLHRRTDLLTIATCAVLAGAETGEAIAEYGRSKQSFFQRLLPLDNGIPSPDTLERVFAKLNPEAFAEAFGRWMAAACEASGLIPLPWMANPFEQPPRQPGPVVCIWSVLGRQQTN
jgi:hypothetical protein